MEEFLIPSAELGEVPPAEGLIDDDTASLYDDDSELEFEDATIQEHDYSSILESIDSHLDHIDSFFTSEVVTSIDVISDYYNSFSIYLYGILAFVVVSTFIKIGFNFSQKLSRRY